MTYAGAGGSPSQLLVAAKAFADRLDGLVKAVLPEPNPTVGALALSATPSAKVLVAPGLPTGTEQALVLKVKGQRVTKTLTLRVQIFCSWDGSGTFLSVAASKYGLGLEDVKEPLLRVEYDRKYRGGQLPAAHIQVHGHRDEAGYLMTLAERGRPKQKAATEEMPRLSDLHLPVGGERFRPCLEDVIEMAAVEFGAELAAGWQSAIAAERVEFRRHQLRAAVRDWPEEAADVLAALNYTVAPPPGVAPAGPSDRLKEI